MKRTRLKSKLTCKTCHAQSKVRNGTVRTKREPYGRQKYLCKACGSCVSKIDVRTWNINEVEKLVDTGLSAKELYEACTIVCSRATLYRYIAEARRRREGGGGTPNEKP